MDAQKQDDQHERTFSSYVRIRVVVLKTYLGRWTIGRSGERGSGISVLPARYDDDDPRTEVNLKIYELEFSVELKTLEKWYDKCVELLDEYVKYVSGMGLFAVGILASPFWRWTDLTSIQIVNGIFVLKWVTDEQRNELSKEKRTTETDEQLNGLSNEKRLIATDEQRNGQSNEKRTTPTDGQRNELSNEKRTAATDGQRKGLSNEKRKTWTDGQSNGLSKEEWTIANDGRHNGLSNEKRTTVTDEQRNGLSNEKLIMATDGQHNGLSYEKRTTATIE